MTHQAVFETARPAPAQTPDASPRARPRLFGGYLVDQGVVSQDDVDEALRLMRLLNSSIGELAVAEGVLSQRQADAIAREQRVVDGRWGELAVELGMGDATGERIDELCAEQTLSNLRFSDALLELGILSATELDRQLDRYEREEADPAHCLSNLPSAYRTAAVQAVVEAFPRLCRRSMHGWVRMGNVRVWEQPEPWDVHATASFEGPHSLAIGLSLEHRVARTLSRGVDRDQRMWDLDLEPVLLAEFLGTVAQLVHGKVEPGRDQAIEIQRVPDELPVRGIAFDLAFGEGCGVLVLDCGR